MRDLTLPSLEICSSCYIATRSEKKSSNSVLLEHVLAGDCSMCWIYKKVDVVDTDGNVLSKGH